MVNTDDFIKRLEIIFEFYSVSASAFADSIGVQRSALSHLMSGRNKPSLDLIMKIVEAYPEVDLYWPLNGKGNFPNEKNEANTKSADAAPAPTSVSDLFTNIESKVEEDNDIELHKHEEQRQEFIQHSASDVEHIVIFYKDGTFKKYRPQ